jgi:predicted metalloprotease
MKWKRGTRSRYVEDRRGTRARRGTKAGLGGIIVVLVAIFLGPEAAQILQQLSGGSTQSGTTTSTPIPADQDADRELVEFVNWVHEDLRSTWERQFEELDKPYEHPMLVLFTEAVNTACGYTSSAVGPFYCPGDNKAYIDLSFYRELSRQLGAPGDFAQAYVLAHELGHHVQNLLGTSRAMRRQQKREPDRKNELSVRLELQADCYAGVWAHSTKRRDLLDRGDIKEGLDAAAAIGDDRLQRKAGRATNSETWTHGSSAQRMRWFQRGLDSGKVDACDTFAAGTL